MEPDKCSNFDKVISASDILAMITRGEPVEFDGVIVEGSLGLPAELRVVSSKIAITNSEIRGEINFNNIHFQKAISFMGTEFKGDADFSGTKFDKIVNLGNAKFDGEVHFETAEFCEYTDFHNAKFQKFLSFDGSSFFSDVYFAGTNFFDDISFYKMKFSSVASFDRVSFGGENSHFEESNFSGMATFVDAEFDGNVGFESTIFGGDVRFSGASFKEINLMGAEFHKKIYLDRIIKVDRMQVFWDSIKDHISYDESAYLILIANFKKSNKLEELNSCYYKFRDETRKYKSWTDGTKYIDYLAWITCGYSTRLSFTLIWIVGSILVFAVAYKIFGGVVRCDPVQVGMSNLVIGDRLNTPSFWDCLYFSEMTFLGRELLNFYPIGLWQYAVMIETTIGFLFLVISVAIMTHNMTKHLQSFVGR